MGLVAQSNVRAAPDDDRLQAWGFTRRLFARPASSAIPLALVVFLYFATTTSAFFTPLGVANWLDPASTIGIMALAVGLTMIGGEFDLSCGVMNGSTGLVMALLAVKFNVPVPLAMLAALGFAVVLGLVNGLLVTGTGLPSFIVTLGTFFALRGLNVAIPKLLTQGQVTISGLDRTPDVSIPYTLLASTIPLFGAKFQVAILWWLGFTVLAWFVLARTQAGNWITSVGGNALAARSVGVPVRRVKIGLYITTATAAWFVGMTTALRLNSVNSLQGFGTELQFIVAAVIGGCLLGGGYGTMVGTAVGAVTFGMMLLGIPFARWEADWYYVFLGSILLIAVLTNNYIRKRLGVW